MPSRHSLSVNLNHSTLSFPAHYQSKREILGTESIPFIVHSKGTLIRESVNNLIYDMLSQPMECISPKERVVTLILMAQYSHLQKKKDVGYKTWYARKWVLMPTTPRNNEADARGGPSARGIWNII